MGCAIRCMCTPPKDDSVQGKPPKVDVLDEKKYQHLMSDKRDLKPPPPENPIDRTFRVLKRDVDQMKRNVKEFFDHGPKTNHQMFKHVLHEGQMIQVPCDSAHPDYIFPEHVDILIVGGGGVGASIAYNLKERARDGLRIAVLEKDRSVGRK